MARFRTLIGLLGFVCISLDRSRETEAVREELPQIWSKIEPHNAYHMVYRLQQTGASEPVTIEEWASFKTQQFRLDLISSETHLSYVSDGRTGEMFKYKPFRCENLKDTSSVELDAMSKLFKGFSLANNSLSSQLVQAFGIGPLWLRAQETAREVTRLQDSRASNQRRGAKLAEFLVSLEDEDYKLGLQFENGMLNVVEWIDTNVELGQRSPVEVLARAKLAMFDLKQVGSATFELPLGYGCRHSAAYENPVQVNPIFDLFAPNAQYLQLSLQVATSRSLGEHMTSWDTRESSTTIQRFSLIGYGGKTRQYFAATTNRRELGGGKLSKTKRIWSVSFGANAATEYEQDMRTGECKVGHQSPGHDVAILFPRVANQPGLVQVWFSLHQLNLLFQDSVDYHLVREEATATNSTHRTGYYERRLDNYEIRTPDDILFNGPVSIIKRVTSLQSAKSRWEIVHVSVAMHFYSQDLSNLEYKLILNPQERSSSSSKRRYPDLGTFSLSTCFPRPGDQERLVIKYALESVALSQELRLYADNIEQKFLDYLFHLETPVEPLQVADLRLSLGSFNLYIEVTLLDLPMWQLWDLRPNTRLAGKASKELIVKMESSLDKCSRSCQHYHCRRFSYNQHSLSCLLETGKGPTTEASTGYQLFSKPTGAEKMPLSPRQILDLLQTPPPTEHYEGDGLLTIVVHLFGRDIKLRPTSIHSDMESMNEFVKTDEGLVATDPLFRMEYTIYADNKYLTSGQQLEGLSSYQDCSESCEQTDCRSFSYCAASGRCRLSQLHQDGDLDAGSQWTPGCTLFALDYLSKFDDLGPVRPPLVAQRTSAVESERDCAHLCLDQQEINCRAFFHCRAPEDDAPSCLMFEEQATDGRGELKSRAEQDARCRLFSRSYLSQFDQYRQKELRGDSMQMFEGLGADECAKRCIGQSCLAFDVCRKPADGGGSLRCRLAGQVEVRKAHLVERENCDAFVLSDKSRFRLIKSQLSLEQTGQGPDRAADEERRDADREASRRRLEVDADAAIMRLLQSADDHRQQTDGAWTESNLPMQILMLLSGFLLGLTLILVGRESYKRLIERSSSVRQ